MLMRNFLTIQVYAGIKPLLVEWFDSIERELLDRICEGCGRFTAWRSSTIDGSMKKLRRHGETLTMEMHLHLNQCTMQLPSLSVSASPFASIGSGQDMITAPDFMAEPNRSEDLMLFDSENGEMDLSTTSNYNEIATPVSLGFIDGIEYELGDFQEFPGAEPHVFMSDLLEEATLYPPYLSTTDWYQGNIHV